MKLRLIFYFLSAWLLHGQVFANTTVTEPDSTESFIYIFRPKSYAGSGTKVTVYINEVEISKLVNGSRMKCELFSEGVIDVKVKSKRPYSVNTHRFKVENGKTYFLKIFWPNHSVVRITAVDSAEGVAAYTTPSFYRNSLLPFVMKENPAKPIPIKETELKEESKRAESKNPLMNGSGFGISTDGYIATNYHVVKGSEFLYVKGINGDFTKRYKAAIAVKDEANDLVILKIQDENFTGWSDSIPYTIRTGLAEVGENIFVLGYPLTTSMGDEIKLTNGIISSKTGFKGTISLYQVSAPVQPGNSGGPLFDESGNLIGIVSAKHLEAENVSYAIKSNYLTNLMALLPNPPTLSTREQLKGKSLPEQVKAVRDFIVLIEVH